MTNLTENTENYDIIKYSITEEAIAAMREECLSIVVKHWQDADGYQAAKEAKKKVVKARTTVNKEREKLKKYFLEGGRAVDAPAKQIFAAIEPVEAHLQEQIDVVEKEIERREAEEMKRIHQEGQRRIAELQSFRAQFDHTRISLLSAAEYEVVKEQAKNEFLENEKRREEQERKLAALEKIQAEQAAKIKEQEARERELQRQLIAQQQAEIAARDAALAEERRQRDEAARVEAKQKAQREAQELKAKQEQEAAEIEKKRIFANAAKAAKDKEMFEAVQVEFPTIEAAWVEIVRLRTIQN